MKQSNRNVFLENILNEVDNESNDKLVIYYEDFTDIGKAKILDAIDASDDMADVWGDDVSRESIEDSLYGTNGKDKVAIMVTTGSAIRGNLSSI
jgi:hypothetical protein